MPDRWDIYKQSSTQAGYPGGGSMDKKAQKAVLILSLVAVLAFSVIVAAAGIGYIASLDGEAQAASANPALAKEQVIAITSGTIVEDDGALPSGSSPSVAGSSPTSSAGGPISEQDAIQKAQARLGSDYAFVEIDNGSFRGEQVYEIEFRDGSKEAEVIVGIETGYLLDIEYEEDDDD